MNTKLDPITYLRDMLIQHSCVWPPTGVGGWVGVKVLDLQRAVAQTLHLLPPPCRFPSFISRTGWSHSGVVDHTDTTMTLWWTRMESDMLPWICTRPSETLTVEAAVAGAVVCGGGSAYSGGRQARLQQLCTLRQHRGCVRF